MMSIRRKGPTQKVHSSRCVVLYRRTNPAPGNTRTGAWSEQPAKTSIAPLPPAYTLYGPNDSGAESKKRDDDRDHESSTLEKTWRVQPQPEQALPPAERTPSHARSPSANGLTQKTQLVPLRLGPIILSDEPQATPDKLSFLTPDSECDIGKRRPRSDSTQELLEETRPQSCRETRETPFQRCSRLYTGISASIPTVQYTASSQSGPDITRNLRTQASRQSLAGTSRRQTTETEATSPQELTGSSTRPRARLQRKRSGQSTKRSHVNLVEQDVFELKSIVNHRRAADVRKDKADDHIPAVAPAMQVRARTQTLNDIGSAFSRPATAHESSHSHKRGQGIQDEPYDPQAPRHVNGAGSRVSGWLSNIMTSSSSNGSLQANEPFYKCTPPAGSTRPMSHTSLCSSTTDLDSPGLTLASSPTATSKGHSRTLTAESGMTPMSPVEDAYDPVDGRKKHEKMWSPNATNVGLAI